MAVGAGPFGERACRQPGWSCVARADCRSWPWERSGGLRSCAVTPRSASAPAAGSWRLSEVSGSDRPLSYRSTWERLPSRDAPLDQNPRGLETAPTSTRATCLSVFFEAEPPSCAASSRWGLSHQIHRRISRARHRHEGARLSSGSKRFLGIVARAKASVGAVSRPRACGGRNLIAKTAAVPSGNTATNPSYRNSSRAVDRAKPPVTCRNPHRAQRCQA